MEREDRNVLEELTGQEKRDPLEDRDPLEELMGQGNTDPLEDGDPQEGLVGREEKDSRGTRGTWVCRCKKRKD